MTARVRSPEFPQDKTWLNTEYPLSISQLRGRVILLDFWTYCCINCLHILPDLKYLEQKYKDSLTVIGVHSAKFDNEKEFENIRQAVLRYDIEHPVVIDSNFDIWERYTVRAWPTLVLIDPEGYCFGSVSGEGKRDALDQLIGQLIREHKEKGTVNFQELRLTLEKQRQPLATPLAFPGKVLVDKVAVSEASPLGFTDHGASVANPNAIASKNFRLFIADSGHHRIIVSTLAGEVLHIIGMGKAGLADGSFSEAQFFAPQGMALDAENQILYVADTENHCLRQIDLVNQQVETIAGTGKQNHQLQPHSGLALKTALNSPWDLEKLGNRLLIAMAGPHQIWEMQLETSIVSIYTGTGREVCLNGSLKESAFAQPSGITTDGRELYVADSEVSSIRAVGLIDNLPVRTVCGSGELFDFGDVDGVGLDVRLQHCLGVEYTQNYLWVADTYNHKIKRIDPHTGSCETLLGDGTAGHQDGEGINVRFSEPSGLSAIAFTFTKQGAIAAKRDALNAQPPPVSEAASQVESTATHLYIADTNNHAIRHVDLDTLKVTTLNFPGLCTPDVCLPSISHS